MKVELTKDEAQVLLDGVNVVISELEKDRDFWMDAPIAADTRDRFVAEFEAKLVVARRARRKIQRVR